VVPFRVSCAGGRRARRRKSRTRAARRPIYYPLTYLASEDKQGVGSSAGFDIGTDPARAPYLKQATASGRPTATGVISLLTGGTGINIYKAIYRDGAPTATRAERRRALIGFAAGSFLLKDLAQAAITTLPNDVTAQLDVAHHTVVGPEGSLEDPSRARIQIADRTWLLVVHDPDRPDVSVPMRLCNLALQEMTEAMNRGWGGRDSRSYMVLQQERAGIPAIAVPAEQIRAVLDRDKG